MTTAEPVAIAHEPMRLAFELAWQSVCAGSLGIGAVVTRSDRSVVTTGRNRLFETDPGDDHLAGTSLAHAELNALAKLRWGAHQNEHLVLWTTLQPCLQCLGAIRLAPINEVRILAPDPLFRGVEGIRHVTAFVGRNWPEVIQDEVDEWSVLSLLFPTHAAAYFDAWAEGWREALPATSSLAVDLARSGELVDLATRAVDVASLAAALWSRLTPCVGEIAHLATIGA